MISIGIDFGTTNSAAALSREERLTVVPGPGGRCIIPSVVSFLPTGEIITGEEARSPSLSGKAYTIISIKRYLGTDKPFRIFRKVYTPVEIASFILKHIRERIGAYTGEPVSSAVVTSPAYFSINQRMALNEACLLSGLQVEEIINEPNAAALSYGLTRQDEQNIMVYDLGGGTCDISIIRSRRDQFEVLAISGDNNLGGDDFDFQIVNLALKTVKEKLRLDLFRDPYVLYRFKQEAEKAKIALSISDRTCLSLDVPDIRGLRGFTLELKRETFEDLIRPLVERSAALVHGAVQQARLALNEVHQVLLVGGSTRIPLVRQKLYEYFKKELYLGMNPDDCVALGAAVHSRNLKFREHGTRLKDVIPLSLGVEAQGGIFIPMITRNSAMPAECTKTFTPITRKQKHIEIRIFQGERIRSSENIYLGKVILKNVRSENREEWPRIQVRFRVDENGLIQVQASEFLTGKRTEISLTPAYQTPSRKTERLAFKAGDLEKKEMRFLHEHRIRDQAQDILDKYKEQMVRDRSVAGPVKERIRKIRTLLRRKKYQELEKALDPRSL
ncbi:MAG: Hsp70 family protein [bacterium]|nr:Hsp70 family protein [bacterium]